jgi:hypothetical protein
MNFCRKLFLRQCIRGLALFLVTAFLLFDCKELQADILVYTGDFIDNQQRTNFNGFENLPAPGTGSINAQGLWFLNQPSDAVWTEQGVRVSQVFSGTIDPVWPFEPNHEEHTIATTNTQGPSQPALDGMRHWYPNGGDDGYTMISLESGGDFSNVGFRVANGGTPTGWQPTLLYGLYSNDTLVSHGALTGQFPELQYLGFSGEGFNKIVLRTGKYRPHWSFEQNFYSAERGMNYLYVDAIEVKAVPEVGVTPLLAVLVVFLCSMFGRVRFSCVSP